MYWPTPLLPALIAATMLASCASSKLPVSAPPAPPPAASMALCPAPPALIGNSMDAITLTLKSSYDAYGACALTHAELVRWIELQGAGR